MAGSITVSVGEILKFDNVITNEGHNYDPSTGVFTCATSGIYVFAQSLDANTNTYVSANIKKNGDTIGFVQAVGTSFSDSSSSDTIVVDLNQGDRIWIIVYILNHPDTTSILSGVYASFSGFLLYRS